MKLTPVAFIIVISFVVDAIEDVNIVDIISITPEFSSNIIFELLFELAGAGA